MRRALPFVAVALALSACQSAPASDSMPRGGFWSTEAVSDQDRITVVRKVRTLDVCALMPRVALGALGKVRDIENVHPNRCRLDIAVDGHLTGIDATWSTGVMFSGEPPMDAPVRELTMGDVRVLLDEEPRTSDDPQVRGSCQAWARFASGADLSLSVRAPGDACATAESLLRIALVEWRAEPPQGTSPDSDNTVITGGDPCAVAPLLGVRVPAADQGITTCRLTVDGQQAIVTYDYNVAATITDDTPAFTVEDRQVYRFDGGGPSGIATLSAVVGPNMAPGQADAMLGPRVPTVSVTAGSAVAEQVMRAALPLVP
ncbi:hypothetical protein [Nocardia rhizosphaerae]|uniref:DUF5642 domain-containing protein n=1 Tax=Nocardia rhizosphaerae TaxID=1691571 RepID=A0ABV8L793_9NOCA